MTLARLSYKATSRHRQMLEEFSNLSLLVGLTGRMRSMLGPLWRIIPL